MDTEPRTYGVALRGQVCSSPVSVARKIPPSLSFVSKRTATHTHTQFVTAFDVLTRKRQTCRVGNNAFSNASATSGQRSCVGHKRVVDTLNISRVDLNAYTHVIREAGRERTLRDSSRVLVKRDRRREIIASKQNRSEPTEMIVLMGSRGG